MQSRRSIVVNMRFERAGLDDRVHVLVERGDSALPRLREEGVRLGVAEVVSFVSANRAYERLPQVDHGLTVLRKLAEDARKGWFHRSFGRGPQRGSLRYTVLSMPGRIRRRLS